MALCQCIDTDLCSCQLVVGETEDQQGQQDEKGDQQGELLATPVAVTLHNMMS